MPDFGGMSADQINASMGFGPGGVGAQGQSQLNNIFGNFGQQTDYYSGQGAAYGRATGGFGGGSPSVFDTGAAPINQNDPALIAKYWELMGGGGGYNAYSPQSYAPTPPMPGPMPDAQRLLGYNPGAPIQNGFGYPGGGSMGSLFDPGTYAPSQQGSSYLPNGQLNQNDPGNIATYYRLMGGGGAMPVGMNYGPRGGTDMNATQFQGLGALQREQQQLQFPMPQMGNDFYTSNNPGFGSSDRFNMQTTQPPSPIGGSGGIPWFGGGGYGVVPPYGGEGDQSTIDNNGAAERQRMEWAQTPRS
jgi:hypothetical protein